MRSLPVVEVDVAPDEVLGLRSALVRAQIYLLVLERAPKAFDEDVVTPCAFAVHADRDSVVFEHGYESTIGELHALIAVEDLRAAEPANRLFHRVDAEVGGQAVRESPSQRLAREQIEHGEEVQEPAPHRDVRDIRAPNVIGPDDEEVSQQIREDRVLGIAPARALLAIERFDAHDSHEPADMASAYAIAFVAEHIAQHSRTGERIVGVQPIHLAHEFQIRCVDRSRLVVQRAAREFEHSCLSRERQSVVAIDHRFALGPSMRPSACAKKSFSSASWPILAGRSLTSGTSLFVGSPPSRLRRRARGAAPSSGRSSSGARRNAWRVQE
jgi:hypothetical protein